MQPMHDMQASNGQDVPGGSFNLIGFFFQNEAVWNKNDKMYCAKILTCLVILMNIGVNAHFNN